MIPLSLNDGLHTVCEKEFDPKKDKGIREDDELDMEWGPRLKMGSWNLR